MLAKTTFGTIILLAIFLAAERFTTIQRGLQGSYYPDIDWKGTPAFSRIDPTITLDIPHHQHLKFPQKMYSIHWTGWIQIKHPGLYTFITRSDDGSSLFINGKLIVDNQGWHGLQRASGTISLESGFHQIELKYFQGKGASALYVYWKTPDRKQEDLLPSYILFPAKPLPWRIFLEKLLHRISLTLQIIGLSLLAVVMILNRELICDRLNRLQRSAREKSKVLSSQFRVPSVFTQHSALSKWIRPGRRLFYLLQQTWVHLLIILGVTLLLVFNNLGRGSIITTDRDEGAYTQIAQTIVRTGEWWSPPSIEGVPVRPPLKYWLTALTFSLLGDTEFFIRIWDAVFGLFTFIVLYFFGTYLFLSKAVGLLSSLILLGCNDFISNHGVRAGVLDSLLVFFFVLSLFFFQLREKKTYFYYLAGVCMGLGALTKSFQGLLPLVIIVFYLILTKRQVEFKTFPFFGMIFLAFLVPAIWYLPQILSRQDFARMMIISDLIHRMQGKIHTKHVQGPFFYFEVIYKGFFPWSLVALPAIAIGFWQATLRSSDQTQDRQIQDIVWRSRKEMIFLLTWILTLFIGFSLSKMKVIWYMHPLYPALSMLIAAVFYFLLKTLRNFKISFFLSPLAIGLLGFLLTSSLYANYERALEQPEKLPIHLFTDYLTRLTDKDYRVILYKVRNEQLTAEQHYYLGRVKDRVIWTSNMDMIEQLHRQGIPLFVIIKVIDYNTQPFFQEHLYSYPLMPPYAERSSPRKLILVYNHIPEGEGFIKN